MQANYHLPQKAVVVSIADPPQAEGAASDDFRPYYAVDVQLLKVDGTEDADMPVLEALKLPVPAAGDESGLFGFPKQGTQVIIAFAYGSPAHPCILQVLPDELAIPPLQPGEQLWQADPATYQKVNTEGDWERVTSAKIRDDSMDREVQAEVNTETYGTSTKTTEADDTEEIGGSKTIEAMGAATLSAGADLNLISAGDTNQTSMGDMVEVIGMSRKSIAALLQQIQVQPGGQIWIGNNLFNVLQLLSSSLTSISTALGTLASHSHPGDGAPPTEALAITGAKNAIDSTNLSLDQMVSPAPQ